MTPPHPLRRFFPALCLGLVLVAWFAALGARHLLPSDEGRYAEIAREMVVTGDWVTVRYNGLKYFEKPPLHMWMTALSFELFGLGDWQARLGAAVSGLLATAVTMTAANRWFGRRVAWLSGLVLLAAPGWNLGGHFNSLDMTVSAFMACTLAAFLVSQHATDARRRNAWLCAAWVAMALAVLAKGLIGIVLPGLSLIVYSAAARDWGLWRRLNLLAGVLCFLAVAAPWFVLISLRNPEFPQFFFIHEHWQRYTSSIHKRQAPFWYFAPQLLVGFLPWLGLLPRVRRGMGQDTTVFRPRLMLVVWTATIFVFFSLSDSKLPGYILPVYPAVAILLALVLDGLSPKAWRRQLGWMGFVALIGLLACPFLLRLGSASMPAELYRQFAVWLAAMWTVALLGTLIAWRLDRAPGAERAPFASLCVASLAWFFGVSLGLVGHETFGRLSSGATLVPAIQKVLTPDMPFYGVRMLDHTLPYYLRHTSIMVEAPDELEFGTQREPDKWVPTLADFESRWAGGTHALAIMSPETRAILQKDGVRMWPIAQDVRRVVVANFPQGAP